MANFSFEKLAAGYQQLWGMMRLTKPQTTAQQAAEIIKWKERYQRVEAVTGVKWFVVGALHIREAGSPPDWRACLHNGERIIGTGKKTKLVPAGRGPFTGPDAWVNAAKDALIDVEKLGGIKWDEKTGVSRTAWLCEKFNGFGYRKHGIPSPYLWGGTSVQQRGKYVADGQYDAGTMDPQIGAMAILKSAMEQDKTARFDGAIVEPPPESKPVPAPKPEPAPETKAGTGIGALIAAIATYFQDNAYWIIPLGIIVVVLIVIAIRKRKPRQLSPKAIE